MRDERRRVVAAGAVAVLAALAVASVWAAGPTRWSPPRWHVSPPQQPIASPQPRQSGTPSPALPAASGPSDLQKVVTVVLIIVVAVAVLAMLSWLARRLRIARRVRAGIRPSRIDLRPAAPAGPEVEAEPEPAPIVRGLARALRILDEDRVADDAIVQAWVGLEEASLASGAGRRPAETPSEYAARVVSRFDADREAAAVLLELYQGVRFGGRHADAEAVRAARGCVQRLADSWHEDATAARR